MASAHLGFRTTLGAVTTTTACVIPVFLVGGLAVQIGADLDFSPAGLGLAVAVYFGVSALSSIPAGALVERFGPTVVARVGIGLAAACLLAVGAAARSYPLLVALLAAGASANAFGQLAANAMLARIPTRRQGLAFGLKQAAIPDATLLSGAAVPLVGLTVGWRWAFGIAAGTAVVALLVVPLAGGAAPIPPPRDAAGPTRAAPTDPGLVVIGLAVALGAASAGSLGTFLVDSAASRGLAPGLAGLTLTFGSVACIVARLVAGWLADRRTRGDFTLVVVQLAIGAGGLALLAAPGAAALAAGVLLGFGFGWAFPGVVNVSVVRLHPRTPAAATSVTQTGVYAGSCVGPIAFGAVAALGGYSAAWLGAAGAMLLAAGLVGWARRLVHRTP